MSRALDIAVHCERQTNVQKREKLVRQDADVNLAGMLTRDVTWRERERLPECVCMYNRVCTCVRLISRAVRHP